MDLHGSLCAGMAARGSRKFSRLPFHICAHNHTHTHTHTHSHTMV